MGLSSSQGRLLSITARLTSNEYESQQISNAKMRLATQSQEASDDYINALNSQQFLYTTYDAKGNTTAEKLTANAMYQYSDMKNQYVLTNTTGQALIGQEDASKFQQANNLDEFLQSYGLKKQWKTKTLEANYNLLSSDEYTAKREAWDNAVDAAKKALYKYDYLDEDGNQIHKEGQSSDAAWQDQKGAASRDYQNALKNYNSELTKANAGMDNDTALKNALATLSKAKEAYSACITYDTWVNTQAAIDGETGEETQVYMDMQDYNKVLDEYNTEAEDYGTNINDLYSYDDKTKAQWYTSLWYRLNGESSEKTKTGQNKDNYSVLDSKLMNSTTWIQDAIVQGAISIEVASKTDDAKYSIPDESNPTVYNISGINWKSTVYSSCSDFTLKDDDQAISKAEAEYERKTQEINAKDEKYQAKIKNLDTEHTALQTEYESIKSALDKNISRSFKTFSS